MDPLTIIAGIGAGIQAGSGLYGIGTDIYDRATGNDAASLARENMALQKDIAEKNLGMAQDAFKWQKDTDRRNYDYMVAENQLQKQREDTAHQREVKDLMSAGLSPLASLKGSSTGATVSQAVGASPVAPQMDGTGISNAYATAVQNQTAMAGLRQDLIRDLFKTGSELTKQKIEHNFEREKINTEFENTMAELEEKYKNEGNLEGQKFVNRIIEINTKFNNDLALVTKKQSYDDANYEAERMSRELGVPVHVSMKGKEYCATWNGRVDDAFKILIKDLEPYLKETGSSEHSGSINSTGGGIGAKLPVPTGKVSNYGNDFDILDTVGGSANFQTSKGSSSGSSKHENPIAYAEQRIKAFWADPNHVILIPYEAKKW